VSLPQFRLLLVLSALGRVPSSRLAAGLGMTASSVTRLADRLETAGLLARGTDPRSRSIVTLEVTRAGLDLVARVVERRHVLLAAVLDRIDAEERAVAARIARRFAELAGDATALGVTGPLPL
jgi:DNA-binding MarR family transcriptional regulator